MPKSCTIRMPSELHDKLKAIADILPYPYKETQTSIIVSGIEMRIAEIFEEIPNAEKMVEKRLREMLVESQWHIKRFKK